MYIFIYLSIYTLMCVCFYDVWCEFVKIMYLNWICMCIYSYYANWYTYSCICCYYDIVFIYTYIYIYIEREIHRNKERKKRMDK